MGRQALRGSYPSRPTDKIRVPTGRRFGAGWTTGQLAIKESESNTRLVGWRGWTPGAHCAMQPRPLFSPSSMPIPSRMLALAIAISPVSKSTTFWERTPGAQLRGRIWQQSSTQPPPSRFPWFTTPSRLALRKAFKYKKSNPVTGRPEGSQAAQIAAQSSVQVPTATSRPTRRETPRYGEVLSSAIGTLMLGVGRTGADAC